MRENVTNLVPLKTFRKELRRNLTPAEAAFWSIVKGSKLDGKKFRRQHSVGPYILDFYCVSEKLGIELDGARHFGPHAMIYDKERKLFLQYFGIRVLRFENKLIFEELDRVLSRIRENYGWSEHHID